MANDKLIYASSARKAILKADPKLAYVIDNVPAADVPKWIPVTERLPENGGSYLVFSSKSKTVFTAHYWKGDRWSNRANGQFITHWMPLPKPPKGE